MPANSTRRRRRSHRNFRRDHRRLEDFFFCIICQENTEVDTRRLLCCRHFVHEDCMLQWFRLVPGTSYSCPYCRRFQVPVNGDDVPPYLPKGYYVFHFRNITFNQQQLNEEWRLRLEQPPVPPPPPGWAQFRSNNLYPYT